ncbi:hypothetical protein CEXT_113231 [Caerostris extrusa]|uniref:Uncharacterized protein n=1 Tax=Caerostris extrusa TaxID=172846 RepID=A0AAV4XAD6_CAEEX|nr:hypothetical protein CEXT_113231 [Caerostris extrusa]
MIFVHLVKGLFIKTGWILKSLRARPTSMTNSRRPPEPSITKEPPPFNLRRAPAKMTSPKTSGGSFSNLLQDLQINAVIYITG